jgi:DNA-directed RNA polymerase subunit RPC12/RpoP
MAQFSCHACGHEGHFVEFKVDPESDADEPDLECPECGSERVSED